MASHRMILKNRKNFTHFRGWQVGYGAFTYHISSKAKLINYVENQKAHHMKYSYRDELTRMLKEHSVEYDNHYLIT